MARKTKNAESPERHSLVVTITEDGAGGLFIQAVSEPVTVAYNRLRPELAAVMSVLGVTPATLQGLPSSQELN